VKEGTHLTRTSDTSGEFPSKAKLYACWRVRLLLHSFRPSALTPALEGRQLATSPPRRSAARGRSRYAPNKRLQRFVNSHLNKSLCSQRRCLSMQHGADGERSPQWLLAAVTKKHSSTAIRCC